MATAVATTEPSKTEDASTAPEPAPSGSKRRLILIAAPVALVGIGAGLWFSGVVPRLLGSKKAEPSSAESARPQAPIYIELPEMVANLNSNPHRPSYVKLQARIEITKQEEIGRAHV